MSLRTFKNVWKIDFQSKFIKCGVDYKEKSQSAKETVSGQTLNKP